LILTLHCSASLAQTPSGRPLKGLSRCQVIKHSLAQVSARSCKTPQQQAGFVEVTLSKAWPSLAQACSASITKTSLTSLDSCNSKVQTQQQGANTNTNLANIRAGNAANIANQYNMMGQAHGQGILAQGAARKQGGSDIGALLGGVGGFMVGGPGGAAAGAQIGGGLGGMGK